jgi:DNA-binding GntR family transcriptional regulator
MNGPEARVERQRGRDKRSPTGKSATAFVSLKREIMLGELSPRQPLVELDLATRFGCSQGTVREALLQLQDEGLVLRNGYHGTQVSECTVEEAVELFRIRQSIECRGIVHVLRHPSRGLAQDLHALLDDMVAAATREDELELASIDRAFHGRIFADAGLPALDPILRRCLIHNHRFKISRSTGTRDLMQTAQRHIPIVAAIEARDLGAASAALFHHIATIVDFGPNVFPDQMQ